MGISGLLPFLKKSCRPCHVRELSETSVGIDAYCLLHRGAFGCAERLAKNEATDAYVVYVHKFIDLLLKHSIKPVLVFDGRNLPAKADVESKRRENRQRQLSMAKQYLREGKRREARECFQRCVDITPLMAARVMEACHERNVDCIVAPYEADAQLARLVHTNIVSWVITEDSDLVLFDCPQVLFKLDLSGQGMLFQREKLPLCLGPRAIDFDFIKFRRMCITSGCDYIDSLPGIGLAKSFKFWSRINNPDLRVTLTRIPSHLCMPNLVVDQNYVDNFIKAEKTFSKQVVFDVRSRRQVRLDHKAVLCAEHRTEGGKDQEDESNVCKVEDYCYAGDICRDKDLALQLALGNVCPNDVTKRLKDYNPNESLTTNNKSFLDLKKCGKTAKYGSVSTFRSIWDPDYDSSNFELEKDRKGVATTAKTAFIVDNSIRKRKSEDNKEGAKNNKGRKVIAETDEDEENEDENLLECYRTSSQSSLLSASSSSKKVELEPKKVTNVTMVLESPPIKGQRISVVSKYFFGRNRSVTKSASKPVPEARLSLFDALKEQKNESNVTASDLKCLRRSLQ